MSVGLILIISAVAVVVIVFACVFLWSATKRGGERDDRLTALAAEANHVDLSGVTDPIERGLVQLISLGPKGQFITVDVPGESQGDSHMMQFAGPLVRTNEQSGFQLLVNIANSQGHLRQQTSNFLKRAGLAPWEDDGCVFVDTPIDVKQSTKIGRDIIEHVFKLPRGVRVNVEVL